MQHPPAFNPNHLDDIAVTQALADGTHQPVLQAFLGVPAYNELCSLAQQALNGKADPYAPHVWILPGLLGTRLGSLTARHNEMLWLEPVSLQSGKLLQLAIGKRRSIRPQGVMLPGYLKLKLILQAAGLRVKFYPYDWRRSVTQLGRQLADDLLHAPVSGQQGEIMLVAHSMGGLVARAALMHPATAKVSRVVQLGTPNHGSFALLQTLRGCYPTVRKLGAVDQLHSAEQLTRQVFRSFYSFYEMLPGAAHTPGLNLFDAQHWPQDALTPSAQRLKQGRRVVHHLAKADRRCHVIAGVGQETTTAVRRVQNEFVFQTSAAGDGTVPTALAHWEHARHWYVRELHGHLPRNTQVCHAVAELLQGESTHLLSSEYQDNHAIIAEHPESELRQLADCKIRWDHLPLSERRDLLEPVISPAFSAACQAE